MRWFFFWIFPLKTNITDYLSDRNKTLIIQSTQNAHLILVGLVLDSSLVVDLDREVLILLEG